MAARPVDQLPYVEWAPANGGTQRLYADAWESENIELPSLVTEHAVSSGAHVSDHYIPLPLRGNVTLRFAGEPIRGDLDTEFVSRVRSVDLAIPSYPPKLRLNASALLGLGGGGLPKTYSGRVFDEQPTRLKSAFALLEEIRRERILVTIGFSIYRAENLALLSIVMPRASGDGSGGSIQLTCTQLDYVETDVATAVPLPLDPRGQQKKKAHAAGTDPTDSIYEPPKQSALKSLLEAF